MTETTNPQPGDYERTTGHAITCTAVFTSICDCPPAAVPSAPADRAALEQEVKRLRLMVDEYGTGASALTTKLKRIRDLHRETCIVARGELPPTAFKCGMCEVLDAPATELRRMADEAQQPETQAPEPTECANCWRLVENRSTPNMGGPPHDHWVHVPGGFTVCHPHRGADSPRAEPRPKAECTCAAAGASFAPSGHYADCPAAAVPQPGKEA